MDALRIILKTIGFIVLGAAIFAVSIGFLYYGSGYRYNLRTRSVYRTGLIYAISTPSRANIFLNDRLLKKKTPSKIEGLNPGEYTLRIEKEGYVGWAKTLSVYESIVTWAQYVLLLPNEISEKVERSRVIDYKLSKNGKRAAVIIDSTAEPELIFTDLSNGDLLKTLKIPTTKNHSKPRIEEFSEDMNAVLLSAAVNNVESERDWFAAHIDKNEATNVSKMLQPSASHLTFKQNGSTELYWLNKTSLFVLNLSTQKVSLIHQNIAGYGTANSKLYAVITTATGNGLYRLKSDGTREEELSPAVPKSNEYRIYESTYDKTIVILHAVTAKSVVIIPSRGTTAVLNNQAENVVVSPSGRFVTMYNAKHVWTYDFDQKREFSFDADNLSEIKWVFTDFHLLLVENGKVVLSDFDGTNRHKLVDASRLPESSSSLKKIFVLHESDKQAGFGDLRSLDITKSF